MIKYELPNNWISFKYEKIAQALVDAKAVIVSLQSMPYQKEWVEKRQEIEFKREVAGTSRIEGAAFTEKELEEAINETTEELITRSQRQARAAVRAYRWIATVPDDRPIDRDLILEIHRHMVTGADDDHCEPGALRKKDENVTFGIPRHRGADGGDECQQAFDSFVTALNTVYSEYDPILQALAAHYHIAAMHPFLDGNGRTARALEALLLQRAGLRDTCFIAMSNYYYEEKVKYLETLSAVRTEDYDLSQFLEFGLKGIQQQGTLLLKDIQTEVKKAVFTNTMFELFNRMKTSRKRVIAKRQLEILKFLLTEERGELQELWNRLRIHYYGLKKPSSAFSRDLNGLLALQAIKYEQTENDEYYFSVRLDWPTEITKTQFLERLKDLPKAKTYSFLDKYSGTEKQ